nr:hypothetical protein GCM10025730_40830 [Promicromonospora thailandica]
MRWWQIEGSHDDEDEQVTLVAGPVAVLLVIPEVALLVAGGGGVTYVPGTSGLPAPGAVFWTAIG